MPAPGGNDGLKLYSLDVEEALVTALLLHEDYGGLAEFTDDEMWFDHLRPIVSCVRVLHRAGKPSGTVFVLNALARAGTLDAISWKGDSGEILVLDILSRHVGDVQAYYSRQLGRLVHYYAEKRRALREAQEAATRTYSEQMAVFMERYKGEM